MKVTHSYGSLSLLADLLLSTWMLMGIVFPAFAQQVSGPLRPIPLHWLQDPLKSKQGYLSLFVVNGVHRSARVVIKSKEKVILSATLAADAMDCLSDTGVSFLSLEDLHAGAYEVSVTADGFLSNSVAFQITSGGYQVHIGAEGPKNCVLAFTEIGADDKSNRLSSIPQGRYQLYLYLGGPIVRDYFIPNGIPNAIDLPPASYRIAADVSATSLLPFYAVRQLNAGTRWKSRFYVENP